jgi:hypothetical protein
MSKMRIQSTYLDSHQRLTMASQITLFRRIRWRIGEMRSMCDQSNFLDTELRNVRNFFVVRSHDGSLIE